MKLDKDAARKLQDLLFELTEGGRAKFLFVLFDDTRTRKRLQTQIEAELGKAGGRAARVSVSSVSRGLFRAIVNQSRRKVVNAIHLVGFEKLASPKQHRVLAELN